MKKAIAAIVLCMVALACTAGTVMMFHLGGGTGTGGPESIRPTRFSLGPGTGGPENIHPVRWLLTPDLGGPE